MIMSLSNRFSVSFLFDIIFPSSFFLFFPSLPHWGMGIVNLMITNGIPGQIFYNNVSFNVLLRKFIVVFAVPVRWEYVHYFFYKGAGDRRNGWKERPGDYYYRHHRHHHYQEARLPVFRGNRPSQVDKQKTRRKRQKTRSKSFCVVGALE